MQILKVFYCQKILESKIKLYVSQDVVYNFINSMIEESKYCTNMMKKHFNKKLVMIKDDDEDFENFAKCCICDNNGDVRVKDHLSFTGIYRGYTRRGCNISVKLNHKIPQPKEL